MFTAPAAPLTEEFFRIPAGDAELHAAWYGAPVPSRSSVLLCTADGEERAWTHRPLVHLARLLAAHGHDVLRFEYEGHGESTGMYELTGIASRVRDVLAALETLRERTGRATTTVLGVRLGAALALEAAARNRAVERLVLWEPIFDIDAYLRNLFRVNLTTQMVVHKKVVRPGEQLMADVAAGGYVSANGYNLAKTFVSELQTLRPVERLAEFGGETLIVAQPATPLPESRADLRRLAFRPIWKEPKNDLGTPRELLTLTTEWIDRARGAGES